MQPLCDLKTSEMLLTWCGNSCSW